MEERLEVLQDSFGVTAAEAGIAETSTGVGIRAGVFEHGCQRIEHASGRECAPWSEHEHFKQRAGEGEHAHGVPPSAGEHCQKHLLKRPSSFPSSSSSVSSSSSSSFSFSATTTTTTPAALLIGQQMVVPGHCATAYFVQNVFGVRHVSTREIRETARQDYWVVVKWQPGREGADTRPSPPSCGLLPRFNRSLPQPPTHVPFDVYVRVLPIKPDGE
jgi:hypothetical protein